MPAAYAAVVITTEQNLKSFKRHSGEQTCSNEAKDGKSTSFEQHCNTELKQTH